MDKNYLPFSEMINKRIKQIIMTFFPYHIFEKIIDGKYKNKKYELQLCNYLKYSSFQYSKTIINCIMKKVPENIYLVNNEIFLPIYSVFASGIHTLTLLDYLTIEKNVNNSFSVDDYLLNVKVVNRTLSLLGGIYYSIDAKKYYKFLKEFKLPDENIKHNYIQKHMPKLSKLLEKYNITFNDFEYYTFHTYARYFSIDGFQRKKALSFADITNKYAQFFKKNPYYILPYCCIQKSKDEDEICFCHKKLSYENNTKFFILKKFRFFFIRKDFTFTIYSIRFIEDYGEIEDKCFTKPKIPERTYMINGLNVTEYYNNDGSLLTQL